MAHLSINLFGSFQVTLNGETATGFDSDKVRALFAYLAVESDRPHRREKLAGLLWPDFPERSARTSLRSALANLRRVIGDQEADPPFLQITRQTIQVNQASDHELDVRTFSSLVEGEVGHPPDILELENAVTCYQGDFLEGFSLPDSAPFEEWHLNTREALRGQALRALHHLAAYHQEQGAYEQALLFARRQVELDPFQEAAHQQVIWSLALSGQRNEALAHYEGYRSLLETDLGVTPLEQTQAMYAQLVAGELPDPPLATVILRHEPRQAGENPYRGLAAFREVDAPFFFGRESFTAQLSDAVRKRSLVAVIVGSSGSGKSSTVFAGLLPQLRNQGDWLIRTCRPRDYPFQAVAGALSPILEPGSHEIDHLIETQKLAEALRRGDLSLYHVAVRALEKHPEAKRLLLVIDQFEELYTLCPDPEERRQFLDELLTAVEAGAEQHLPPFTLLLTLRADFMGQALTHRPFSDALQDGALILGPMNRDELRAAIENPAEIQGAAFETGLVARLLDDVGEEPGNLPLLEFALSLLWDRLDQGWATHATYEEIGRVDGALARYAEEVFNELTTDRQEQAKQVFVQLVQPGQGTEDTRRVATRTELGDERWKLIQYLADHRLVVTGIDEAGLETVEVVHEAMIRNWERLQGWMDAERAFRIWQEGLRVAVRQWESSGRDEGALMRGIPLAQAEGWLAEREVELSSAELAFIESSLQLRSQVRERREARRRRTIIGLAAGFVIALALSLVAYFAQQNALTQASIGLASQAIQELEGSNPDRAILLALEAVESYPYTWQAERALGQAVLGNRMRFVLDHKDEVNAVTWSPTGDRLATASRDGTAKIWDASTGEELLNLSHEGEVLYAVWSPDGTNLLSIDVGGLAKIWDPINGQELVGLSGLAQDPWVAWSPAGDRIASAEGFSAIVWDWVASEKLFTLSGHEDTVWWITWSPLGDRLATASFDGTAKIWDAATGEEIFTLANHTDVVEENAWSPSGDRLVTSSWDGTARVWDTSTGEGLLTLNHGSQVFRARWSPDGSTILTSGDMFADVWDAETGERLLQLYPTTYPLFVWAGGYSPDGELIATFDQDGVVHVWDASTGDERFVLRGHDAPITNFLSPSNITWAPSGDRLATASEDGTVIVWDLSPALLTLRGHDGWVWAAAWSPEGDRIVTTNHKEAIVWDAGMGEQILRIPVKRDPNLIGWIDAGIDEVVWSPMGDKFLTVDKGGGVSRGHRWGRLYVYDASTGEELFHKSSFGVVGFKAAWYPSGDRILFLGEQGHMEVWDIETGENVIRITPKNLNIPPTGTALSPDGKLIVTTYSDGTANVYDAETGEERLLLIGSDQRMGWPAWSPDGRFILTHSDDDTGGRKWDASTGELVMTFSSFLPSNHSWSPAGDRFMMASWGTGLKVVDAETGAELLDFNTGEVCLDGDWSPDGTRFVVGCVARGVATVYPAWPTLEDLIAYAKDCCVIRELTPDERELFGLPPK